MQVGFSTLREFVTQRPTLRVEAMNIILELTTHPGNTTIWSGMDCADHNALYRKGHPSGGNHHRQAVDRRRPAANGQHGARVCIGPASTVTISATVGKEVRRPG